MPTTDCRFCAIDPRRILAESDLALTLRDGFPVSPGHTLVIPRRHFADLFHATPEELVALWRALRAAADGPVRERGADGFNLGVNVGAAAGQIVMHLHVHLILRYAGDQADPRGGIRRIFPELADYWSAPRP